MEEKDIVMTEATEETKQPAWEVVPDFVEEKVDEVEEVLEEAEEELKKGFAAAKEWVSDALYEVGRVYQEHKKTVLIIVGAVAAVAAMAGALWAFLKKNK